jgi:CBS domain-containing protein
MEPNVLKIPTKLPFREIQHLFVVAGCHGAPVVDETDAVVGVISAMDLLRAADQALDEDDDEGENAEPNVGTLTAIAIASPRPVWVAPDMPAEQVAQLMRQEGIHRVLVGADGRLEGILSAFDLLRAVHG